MHPGVSMITLHSFGPFMGTPDSSPFVMKVMVLLKMAGLLHQIVRGNPLIKQSTT